MALSIIVNMCFHFVRVKRSVESRVYVRPLRLYLGHYLGTTHDDDWRSQLMQFASLLFDKLVLTFFLNSRDDTLKVGAIIPRNSNRHNSCTAVAANLKKVDSGSKETSWHFHVGMLLHKFLGEPRPMGYSFFTQAAMVFEFESPLGLEALSKYDIIWHDLDCITSG